MTNPAKPVSVTTPVSMAIEQVKMVLFRPFDLSRWFAIGFCAWLATLGDGGGGGGGMNFSSGNNNRNLGDATNEAVDFARDNLSWIIPLVILVAIIILLFAVLILWLSSRGRFMFLHNVVTRRAEVVAPWNAYSAHGNSLFMFRVGLAALAFCLILPFVVLAIWAIVRMVRADEAALGGILVAGPAMLAALIIGVVFAVIEKFTKDFVVPIMRLRTPSCLTAWSEFLRLLGAHAGRFTLYILFHIMLSIAVGILLLAVVIVTCCVAGCLMAIPYLGAVFLLPVHVFLRSYSLHYLAQYGPDYDAFPPTPLPPPSPTIPPEPVTV